MKGLQILRDQPDIIAQPDDFYPDWLWELLDNPAHVEARAAARRDVEKKKEIYIAQLEEVEIAKRLRESKKQRVVKPGEKRTVEEKKAVRREAQNEMWLVNREKEYDVPQFEMPPERNAKYHKQLNKKKILDDNYIRARGMK
jgi:cytochrome b involved in lipid metabolism